MITADTFRHWFEYEQDAHAKTLASLNVAASTYADNGDFQKAVDLASHIVAARMMWLHRMTGVVPLPATLFPSGTRLNEVAEEFARMHQAWSEYLTRIGDAELGREFEYHTYAGEPYRDHVVNVLTTLFGHSSYHRGQIALLLRRAGAEPAETDFVFWTRRPIAQRRTLDGDVP